MASNPNPSIVQGLASGDAPHGLSIAPNIAPTGGSGQPSDVVFASIARAAAENGVPLALALAIAEHESNFDANNTTGDNGHSWGLYQLYDKGEGAGMGNNRLNPYINASTALKVVGDVLRQHPNMSWGQVAAAAQRPADQPAYADAIDGIVKRARNDPNYFASSLPSAHLDSTAFAVPTADQAAAAAAGTASPASAGTLSGAPLGNSPTTLGAVGVKPTGVGGSLLPQYQANAPVSIQYYGAIAALAQKEPDLQKLMLKYANQDLSNSSVQMRLEADIRDTPWYKRTSDAQRAAETLLATNPTEYHRQFGNALLTATNLANQLGVHLPGTGLQDFTTQAYNNGWTPEEEKHYLLAEAGKSYQTTTGPNGLAQQPTGDIGTTMTALQNAARQYLVPVSDVTRQQWAAKIMNGEVNQNDFTNYLKTMAKSLHPEASQAIDSGITPEVYYDPYKQVAAQTLQVAPDSVNLNDPKWQQALFQIDPKTGERKAMSLVDWGRTLRSDPTYGYSKTPQAQSQAADFAQNILQEFGAVGNYGGNG